jgi:hypothetical protein
MENEEWKVIDAYPNYEISSHGRIRNKKKLLTPSLKNGYYTIKLANGLPTRKTTTIHRLVALAFVENANPLMYKIIDHIDRDTTNNKSSNLRWCNISQNSQNWKGRNEGVTCRRPGVYEVSLKYNYISLYLGRYNDEEKAKQVYRCVKDALASEFSPYKS